MAFSWFWRKCQQICSQGGNSPFPTKKALTNGLPAGEHTEVPRRRTVSQPAPRFWEPAAWAMLWGVTDCRPPSSGLLELQGCCGNSFLPYPRGFDAAPRTEDAGQAPSWKKMGYGSRVNPWPVAHSCEGNSRRMVLLWALLPSSSHYIKASSPHEAALLMLSLPVHWGHEARVPQKSTLSFSIISFSIISCLLFAFRSASAPLARDIPSPVLAPERPLGQGATGIPARAGSCRCGH